MRKFRLLKTEGTCWDKEVEVGKIYHEDYFSKLPHCFIRESDFWQEVFDHPIPEPEGFLDRMHKDTDLGYFAGLAMVEYIRQYGNGWDGRIASESIATAKELIKQLDEEQDESRN